MLDTTASIVATVAAYLQLSFEAASVITVALGGLAFLRAWLLKAPGPGGTPRLALARFLVVALELQLAADIIATATDPSLEELGKLAITALIRTFLNYFLVLEMRGEQRGV